MFVTVLAAPVNHEDRGNTVFPDQKVRVMRTSRCVSVLYDRETRWRHFYCNAESAYSADRFGSDLVRD